MDESERREFMTVLLDNVQVYEERLSNGQWLRSMEFILPIIKEDMKLRLDNDSHIETVVLLSPKGWQHDEEWGWYGLSYYEIIKKLIVFNLLLTI